LSDEALRAVVKRLNKARMKAKLTIWTDPRQDNRPITPHGFRSTFKDWVAEETDWPDEVSEMALAHAVEKGTKAAYRRGMLYKKRVLMMEEWRAYVMGQPLPENVLEFKKAASK
jgi:integrase